MAKTSPFTAFVQGLEIARQSSLFKRQRELDAQKQEELAALKKQREGASTMKYLQASGGNISGPDELNLALEYRDKMAQMNGMPAQAWPQPSMEEIPSPLADQYRTEVSRLKEFGQKGERFDAGLKAIGASGSRTGYLDQQYTHALELENLKHQNRITEAQERAANLNKKLDPNSPQALRNRTAASNIQKMTATDADYKTLGMEPPKKEEASGAKWYNPFTWGDTGQDAQEPDLNGADINFQ